MYINPLLEFLRIAQEHGVDMDDVLAWAVGEDFGTALISETPERWNKRHGSLFMVLNADLVDATFHRIVAAYKQEVLGEKGQPNQQHGEAQH
jgi:hypothetical protein